MHGKRLHLYLRTVRHIKPRQLVCFVLRRVLPTARVTPYGGEIGLRQLLNVIPGVVRSSNVAAEGAFRFLNISKPFDLNRMDWTCRDMSKLWRYNLHYFDYLHAAAQTPEINAGLISSWIEHNRPGTEDAWEPFTVSLRVVNWIKYFLQPENQGTVRREWLRSLHHQALWLERNIESHLLANHYFKNGKALFFAGTFFDGEDADRWLKKGARIVGDELDEQILPDGGHFERSPMYHAMILEDCLDLLNLGLGTRNARLVEKLTTKCRAMLRFLGGMIHPDGEIALFNDAAFGIEATFDMLADYFQRLTGEKVEIPDGPCWSFPDTGYFVMAPRLGDRLIIDCGPVGPDYQPGHSHCDCLSFELSLKGRRVIVDSGCCQYVDGDIRRYNRGDHGHNTLTIDGENQSEVWGAHRCGRRAYPIDSMVEQGQDACLRFSGAHNGYRHLKGSPTHRRTVTWSNDTLLVEDRVEGGGVHDIEARLHIHPGLEVMLTDGKAIIRDQGTVLAAITPCGSGRIERDAGWYCPEFGVQLPCVVLKQQRDKVQLPFFGGWILTTGG